ncbi:glycosyltransferase family 61 protein [Protaetiibacter intestinalis]|uniref:Glycosyltransferase family 61 protein n=1 Tax=Protaetiibacter intestinalis TaxID=2419774 RepID=A0A387B7L6_9MICO|nr:glycosyltransferase family 61 protein [Protaetiibacter intestinalis]AYF98347.1 glycosyltransferase family 61 protein [Protaetiibacter intestinalis]
MSTGYRSFADRVADLAIAFRRDHQVDHLDQIRRLIEGLGSGSKPPSRRRVVYTGWVSRPFRVDRSRLLAANSGYAVAVGHPRRKELGVRGALQRFGLRVTAEGPIVGPDFRFFVSHREQDSPLPASNDLARRQLLSIGGTIEPAPNLLGYLDAIQSMPVPSESSPALWLDALVQESPALLWDFVDSPSSDGLREQMAAALATFPTNDRWADRYRLAAEGLSTEFASDLTALRVDRPVAGGSGIVPVKAVDLQVSGSRATAIEREQVLPAPDPGWLTVDDALIQDGGTVTSGDRFICYEGAADPARDFVAGQYTTTFGSSQHPEGVLLRRAASTGDPIDEAILLAGRSDANWFHWMVEYLPRVVGIPETVRSNVPLLVTPRVPPTGIQALRDVSDRPLVFIDPDVAQAVSRLHVAAPPVEVLDTTKIPWADGIRANRAPLDELRRQWGVDTARNHAGRQIFVTRRSRHRGITNEHLLARIARRHGLEVVDPSGLDYFEQRKLFADAEVLVGASGAVMANYLFMRPGSRILALTSRQLADFVLPAVLASIAGCSFEYLLGSSAARLSELPDRNHWIHADFSVPTNEFDLALRNFL